MTKMGNVTSFVCGCGCACTNVHICAFKSRNLVYDLDKTVLTHKNCIFLTLRNSHNTHNWWVIQLLSFVSKYFRLHRTYGLLLTVCKGRSVSMFQ